MDEKQDDFFEPKDREDYDYEEEIKRMYPDEDEREEFVTQGL